MQTLEMTPAVPSTRRSRVSWRRLGLALTLCFAAGHAFAGSILFIGNSFTYGQGSAVHYYRAGTVTDLNGQGNGGLPALFKS
ncbi:MAG TPA: hypothetical protein VGM74_21360, partial [Burkholderiaceae bacterium]